MRITLDDAGWIHVATLEETRAHAARGTTEVSV